LADIAGAEGALDVVPVKGTEVIAQLVEQFEHGEGLVRRPVLGQ
jgi:hypothetical protein